MEKLKNIGGAPSRGTSNFPPNEKPKFLNRLVQELLPDLNKHPDTLLILHDYLFQRDHQTVERYSSKAVQVEIQRVLRNIDQSSLDFLIEILEGTRGTIKSCGLRSPEELEEYLQRRKDDFEKFYLKNH